MATTRRDIFVEPKEADRITTTFTNSKSDSNSASHNKDEFGDNPNLESPDCPGLGTGNHSATVQHEAEGFALDSFILFPKLPVELRRKIWRSAANIPRLITFTHLTENCWNPALSTTTESWIITQKATVSQPSILQACAESRNECMPLFQPIFGKQIFLQDEYTFEEYSLLRNEPYYLFNAEVDTIYFTMNSCLNSKDGHNVEEARLLLHRIRYLGLWSSIKSIAIDLNYFSTTPTFHDMYYAFLKLLRDRKTIKEVIMVLKDPSTRNESGNLGLVVPEKGDLTDEVDELTTRTFRGLKCGINQYWRPEDLPSRDDWDLGQSFRAASGNDELANDNSGDGIPVYQWPEFKVMCLVKDGVRL